MNRPSRKSLLLLLSLLIPWHSLLAVPSADALVKKADEARGPAGTFSFTVRVEDREPDSARTETAYKVYSKDMLYTLVETVEPVRLKGRKLLMRENDLWLYLPDVKRPTRVSFQQRLSGEVSNGDLARTNFAGDYDATHSGEETVEKKACYKLSLSAKRKDVTYHSISYWVDKSNGRPVKADFFALSGKLLKTAAYSGFENVLGSSRMTDVLITDALHPARQSQLKYSNYRREKLPDAYFNKESLAE
jgi:hypothetical protein